LNSDFIEGHTQVYRLDEDDSETVRLLIQWFYTQELGTRQPEEELEDRDCFQEDLALAKLWVLADKLLLPRLQNQVIEKMEEIRTALNELPTSCATYIYEKTAAGSPLRRWLVHVCAGWLDQEYFASNAGQFPHEMLMDMALFWRGWAEERSKAEFSKWKNGKSMTEYLVEVPDN
jgi:hypothetical protein